MCDGIFAAGQQRLPRKVRNGPITGGPRFPGGSARGYQQQLAWLNVIIGKQLVGVRQGFRGQSVTRGHPRQGVTQIDRIPKGFGGVDNPPGIEFRLPPRSFGVALLVRSDCLGIRIDRGTADGLAYQQKRPCLQAVQFPQAFNGHIPAVRQAPKGIAFHNYMGCCAAGFLVGFLVGLTGK